MYPKWHRIEIFLAQKTLLVVPKFAYKRVPTQTVVLSSEIRPSILIWSKYWTFTRFNLATTKIRYAYKHMLVFYGKALMATAVHNQDDTVSSWSLQWASIVSCNLCSCAVSACLADLLIHKGSLSPSVWNDIGDSTGKWEDALIVFFKFLETRSGLGCEKRKCARI